MDILMELKIFMMMIIRKKVSNFFKNSKEKDFYN